MSARRGGALALLGPNQAIFSPDLAVPPAWDIQTADGLRLRGGFRSLRVTDPVSGQSQVLATVKASAPGQLVPPNTIVYENCVDGLAADVVLVWRHNSFSQNVILKQQPVLPAGVSANTARLEVVSELIEAPDPVINQRLVPQAGAPDLVDDVTLGFGSLVALVGKAFPVDGASPALSLAGGPGAQGGVDVRKQWTKLPTGGAVLVESVGWKDILPFLQALPTTQRAAKGRARPSSASAGERADASDPARGAGQRASPGSGTARSDLAQASQGQGASAANRPPIQLASKAYQPTGFLVDFDLSGSVINWTFTNGVTFYIANSFSVGPGTATFQNCTIKYADNAYLTVYGPVSFPTSASGGLCLFTSKNDDGSGDIIATSSSRPSTSAGGNPELSVYYDTNSVTVQNAFFRWAQAGLGFAGSGGPTHYVQSTSFKDCGVGIRNNDCGQVALQSAVTYCDVSTPISGSYNCYSGSMSQVCQTELYFNAATNAPYVGMNGSSASPYPGSGQSGGSLYFDTYLNGALNNSELETNFPPCTRLVLHLVAASSYPYVTDGIRMPADPHRYYAGGLSLLGGGTNNTTLLLKTNASGPANWDDKHVFQSEYPDSPQYGHFFFAPFTNSDMTIDCNWAGQTNYNNDLSLPTNRYKLGAIFMPAKSVDIERITVKNCGAKGLDIRPPFTNDTGQVIYDPGTEAFPIWAATANLGQTSTPINIQSCEVTGFTSVHGGYASCIIASTHWILSRVPGDTNVWTTTAALVQNNWIHSATNTIALGAPSAGNALTNEWATFSNNYCDGIGSGFNSDYNGAKHITISNNTFTNCYQGINLGGPNWGCGNYAWLSISICSNKFAFLGQPSGISYYKFSNWRSAGSNCTWWPYCGVTTNINTYTNILWDDCFAIRLAGSCGSSVGITNNACTTVPMSSWQQPAGGSNQYYVVQVLTDSWVPPGLLQPNCNRDNASPSCSGNTVSLCAYSYSPNDPANDWTKRYMVGGPSGLVGYWRLNETSGTNAVDGSGNGNTGALQTGASWTTGYYGGAVSLDGTNGYVTIPDASSLRPANVTVAAWFNASGFASAMTVVTKPWNGPPPWSSPYVSWLIRINNQGTLEFDVGNAGGYSVWTIAVPWPYLQVGQWYHVALTYDGTTLTAYLNGVSLGTNGTVNGSVGYGSTPVLLGADYGASPAGDYLAGKVDDVRVYNRALSGSEITAVMNGAGSGGN